MPNSPHIDKRLPERYLNLLSQAEYETLLVFAMAEAAKIGDIQKVEDGGISVQSGSQENDLQFFLDNLVRKCKNHSADATEWQPVVEEHFGRFNYNGAKINFYLKDFEYAEPHLRVVIRSLGNMPNIGEYITRTDVPGTTTYLILDTDNLLHFIQKKEMQEWGLSETELFDIALANLEQEQVNIGQMDWKNQFEAYAFLENDYGATYLVAKLKDMVFSQSKYGAVVVLPAKGAGFVHPLHQPTALDFIESFYELHFSMFMAEEVPVSRDFYWYYEGQYEVFPVKQVEGRLHYVLPEKLQELINTP